MANKSLQNERTEKTILADSGQAVSKYGFAGETGSAITSAPKMGDMWFIEFVDVESGSTSNNLSSFAKTVSPITVTTDVTSADRYGKRVHIPTYVNFPEVSISLYDKTDGSGFVAANDMYSRFFKNADLSTDNASLDSSIKDINSGRKFTDNQDSSYIKSFRKIVIYHFFGSFGQGIDRDPRGREQLGEVDATSNGSIQKIEIINPLITSITFSGSDYSDSSLRTIDLTFQPENIIFGTPSERIAVPDWMKQGLEFILEDLDPSNSVDRAKRLLANSRTNKQLDAMITGLANGNNLSQNLSQGNTISDRQELMGVSSDKTARDQLSRLRKLSGTLKYVKSNSDSTAEEKADALRLFEEEIANAMPMPASSLKQYDDFGEMQNALNSRNRFPDNPYSSDVLYPNVAGFPNSRLNGNTDKYAGFDLASLISTELISSFMNGRSINLDNITSPIAQSLLGGNTGIGNLLSLGKTSQSKYGIAGDLVRDSLLKSTRRGESNNGVRTTIVSTAPTISSPTSDFSDKDTSVPGKQFDSKSRNLTQNNITNLRNKTGGIR